MELLSGVLSGNGFARNFVVFGVNCSLSRHSENRKTNFLVLGEGLPDDINESFGKPQNNFNINFN